MITMKDMIALLKRIWWKNLLIAVAAGAFALGLGLLFIGKTYTAEAVLFVNVQRETSEQAGLVFDPTSRIIGRCKIVMDSYEFRNAIEEKVKNRDIVEDVEISVDGSIGSVTVKVSSTKKGEAKETVSAFVEESMRDYLAAKVKEHDAEDGTPTFSTSDFVLVSTPIEDRGEQSTSLITLTVFAALAGFVISYLIWLAVLNYRMQQNAEAEQDEDGEPAAGGGQDGDGDSAASAPAEKREK